MANRQGPFRHEKRHSPYSWRDRSNKGGNWSKGGAQDGGGPAPPGGGLGPMPDRAVDLEQQAPPGAMPPGDAGEGSDLHDSKKEKKFSNRARLFVGNLPREFTTEELKALFEKYGEVNEVFVQKEKNFGFVRMGYRSEAERAIENVNGEVIKGREIKVRFAASSCSVKVSNLHPMVSNELLAKGFSQFGEVERAVVVTDERGNSLGYGIVDFARKSQAINAIQRCKTGLFKLTKTPMPVLVTEMIRDNDEVGQPERALPRTSAYYDEYECPPVFIEPGTLEYEMASRWVALYDSEKMQKDDLEAQLKENRKGLEVDMSHMKEQQQAVLIRQEIVRHQQEQMRLTEALRQHELRRHMGHGPPPPPGPPGGGGPPPSMPSMPPHAQGPPQGLLAVPPGHQPPHHSPQPLFSGMPPQGGGGSNGHEGLPPSSNPELNKSLALLAQAQGALMAQGSLLPPHPLMGQKYQ